MSFTHPIKGSPRGEFSLYDFWQVVVVAVIAAVGAFGNEAATSIWPWVQEHAGTMGPLLAAAGAGLVSSVLKFLSNTQHRPLG